MLVTVTNASGSVAGTAVTLNALDVHDGGSLATGGARKYPLPYPFAHIGSLADTATKQLPMHPADWRYKRVPWLTFEPRDEWNHLIHRGWVTLAFAAQTAVRDAESLAANTI